MLWTQTDRSLCALAQMAPRGQAALLSGLGHALTQATGRQPDDLCHRKGTSHLPDHGRGRRRLTKPKSFRSGVLVQNVQTPVPLLLWRRGPGVWTFSAGLRAPDDIEAEGSGTDLPPDRKSTRLNSSHLGISYAAFC